MMRKLVFALALFGAILNLACGIGINKTVHIEDGDTHRGSINSVNGGIIIGKNAVLRGTGRSVNGRIEVGDGSEAQDLQTVNGRIRIGREVRIDGDVESVNGSIRSRAGTTIDGKVAAINGRIELERTIVERDIHTTNGDVTLSDNTRIKGDIVVEGRGKNFGDRVRVDIRISGNSVVEGDVIVDDKKKDVRVYLSDGGKVLGEIKDAEVIKE
ncbi:MAG: hypothetical protein ACE5G1_06885 [bacterium]